MRVTLFVGLVATGCETSDPCPNGSMLDGPNGLVLTAEEHVEGWGTDACADCHVFAVLHRTGCTPDVDLAAIREQVETDGEAVCADCHGTNGVTP